MRFGPTRLQVATILAKGLRRPKLNPELRIGQQTVGGVTNYVVKVPNTASYNRYGEYEYEVLTLCDGTRTPVEIAEEMSARHPDKPLSEKTVLEFFDGMEPGMWEQSLGEKNLAVLEKIRDERKSRVNQSNILQITFKAWDPDKTLARLDPYLSWIFTRGFVIFSLALFSVTLIIWAADWSRIAEDTKNFYQLSQKSPSELLLFWVLLFALGGIHEFGHGLTCKHFGGEVHQMGFMLIYFTPAFYTDTTDVYLFDRTSRREWVIFAGIWIELVVCGLATLVWHFSMPGGAVSVFSYKLVLFSGFTSVVLNLDPFIKADGYYALSQYLHMESLREESFEYLKGWLLRTFLGRDVELPATTRKQRRIFLAYGIGAAVYSVSLLFFVAVWVKDTATSHFGLWGYPVALGVIYFFFRKKIQVAGRVIGGWLRAAREGLMAWKATRAQQVGGFALLFLLFVPPVPSRVAADFSLEPVRRADVRATVPGSVSEIRVKQGDDVRAGEVVAILHNVEIEAAAAELKQQLALAMGRLRDAEGRRDFAQAATAANQVRELEQDLGVAETRSRALTLLAPIDGKVISAGMDQRLGEYLPEGTALATIANEQSMKARVLVRDWDLQNVRAGAPARLKVTAYPFDTFSGTVQKIMPAAALDRPVSDPGKVERYGQELTNYFAVVLEFPNADGRLREGMTGTAKISSRYRPLAWQAGRGAWRWLRTQVW
jgi:putative peptide zinc metalloprotease protein